MLPLEFCDLLQLAERFGLFRFGGILRVENSFELFFFATQLAHRLGIVESETAFLEPSVAGENSGDAGGRIDQGGQADLSPVEFRNSGYQIDAMYGLWRR